MTTTETPSTINDPVILATGLLLVINEELPEAPAYVEQTGGGVATIYIGTARTVNGEERYWLALGPGSFDWHAPARSEFTFGDLYCGPDDWGERHALRITSTATLRQAIRHYRSAPDWREDPAHVVE